MDIVCDTNVWYDISSGSINPEPIKVRGHKLLATPISVLEIVSKMDEANFALRQGAARSIVKYASEILIDPENHLAELWGLQPEATVDWWTNNRAVADAKSFGELGTGIVNAKGTQKIKVNLPTANAWRTTAYQRFLSDVVTALDQVFPGYGKQWSAGRFRQLSDADKSLFRKAVQQPQVKDRFLRVTYERAAKAAGIALESPPPVATVARVTPLLSVFVDVYSEFMVDAGCYSKPQENDAGDVEVFIYAQNGRRIMTNENKWNRLAVGAGHKDILYP